MNISVKGMIVVSALVLGLSANSASAATVTPKTVATPVVAQATIANTIAIVDVQKVVASSAQVAALKKEQEAKAKEIVTFVDKARKDVAATTDTKKKQALEEKYNKELNQKRDLIEKNYTTKLAAIDAEISKQIANIAKAEGYSMVIAKGIVLYGGNDITDSVIKVVK